MTELGVIKTCFSLILGLQITAVTGQTSSSFSNIAVRAGDDVTLSCENLIDGLHECDRTDWFLRGSRSSKLVIRGQIVVEDNPRSDRLSLTENCSLVLKKVSDGDVGLFECQQIRSGRRSHSTLIGLSVVSMTEHDDGDEVTLTCSVSAHRFITNTVQWLHEGRDVGRNTNMESATVTFPSSDLSETKKSYQCQVTDDRGHVFTFPAPTSGEEPALLRLIIVSVGLMALIITVVTVNVWTRTKGNKKQTNDNVNSDEDEDDGAVNYENVNQSS